jgi:hypothetical protein
MDDSDANLLLNMEVGVDRLLDPSTNDLGIVAEGNVADYMRGRHCELYSVGNLNDRAFAFGFPLNNTESGTLYVGLRILQFNLTSAAI